MEPLSSLVLVTIHMQLCMYTVLEEQQNRKCEEKKQVGTNWSPCLWYWSASKICCKYSRAGVYTFFGGTAEQKMSKLTGALVLVF